MLPPRFPFPPPPPPDEEDEDPGLANPLDECGSDTMRFAKRLVVGEPVPRVMNGEAALGRVVATDGMTGIELSCREPPSKFVSTF